MKSEKIKTKAIGIAFAAILALSLFTAGFTGITSAQIEETEPNNQFGDANLIPLDTPVTATINPVGDYDWFKVVVTKTGVLTASVTNVPAAMRADVHIYGANNNHLTGATGDAGDDKAIAYDVSPGDYYIRIRDYVGGSYTTPYRLTVTLDEVPDAYEPNGDFAHAKEIALGTAIDAYIFGAGDYDWFKVNLTKTGVLNIAVTNLPSPYMRANIELYGANKNHITYITGAAGVNTTLSRDLGPGWYYIQIRDSAGKRYTDPYTLNVTVDEVPDAYEPNGDFGHAKEIALDTPIKPFIFPAGDYDWFKVNVTKTGVLNIAVTNLPSPYMCANIELYGVNKNHITYTTGAAGVNTTLSRDLGPGWYYIRIRDSAGKRYTDPYTLTVTQDEVPDAYEPNPDFARAHLLNTAGSFNPYIFSAGDYDWFKVFIKDTGTLSVSITDVPTPYMRMNIEIYDKNKYRLKYATGSSGADVSASCSVSRGFYYIRIRDSAGKRATTPYTMTIVGNITMPPPPEAPVTTEKEFNGDFGSANLISLDTHVTAKISPRNEYDWFKVELTPGSVLQGVLKVSVTNVPTYMQPRIYIYDQNYGHITSVTGVTGKNTSVSYDTTLSKPWSYYIRIEDYAGKNHTEPYTLTVTLNELDEPTEPNHDFAHASKIELNNPTEAYIFPKNEYDWYKVELSPGSVLQGVLKVSVTNVPTYMKPRIYMYNQNYAHVTSVTGSTGTNTSVSHDTTLSKPWSYYIRVEDYNGKSHTEPYTLTVTLNELDEPTEPNHDFAHASKIELNNPTEAYIFPRYEYDWYKVELSPGSVLQGVFNASVTNVPTYMRPRIYMYNQNYGHVTSVTGDTGKNTSVSFDTTLSEPWSYYIRVEDYNDRSHTEPYTLAVTFNEALDAYEPNNDFAHAFPLTTAEINAYIFGKGDYDWFRGYVDTPGTITCSAKNVPSPFMRMRVEIYDKNNNRRAGTTGAAGADVSCSYDATTTGYYYFRIYDYAGGRSTNSYTMTVSGISVVDTIPPSIFNLQPKNSSVVTENKPVISASYSDIGVGLDLTSVKLYVDGSDVTASAAVLPSQVTYTPTTALPDGKHNATVYLKDKANNLNYVTWYFTVATQPTALISMDKTKYSPGDTMNITIRMLNPTDTQRNLQLLWYLYSGGWTPVATIPVTLNPGFDEEYFIPYTVQNWGASSFTGLWLVALVDADTGAFLNYDYVTWTYVPAITSTEKSESEVVSEITANLREAIEEAQMPIPKSHSVTAAQNIDTRQLSSIMQK